MVGHHDKAEEEIPHGFMKTRGGFIKSIPKAFQDPKAEIEEEVQRALAADFKAHKAADAEAKQLYNELRPKFFKKFYEGDTPFLAYAGIFGAIISAGFVFYSFYIKPSINPQNAYQNQPVLTQPAPIEYSTQVSPTATIESIIFPSPTAQYQQVPTSCSYYPDNTLEYNKLYSADSGFQYRAEQLTLMLNWVYNVTLGNNVIAMHSDPALNTIPPDYSWNIGIYMRDNAINNAKDLTLSQMFSRSSFAQADNPLMKYLCGFSQ